MQDSLGFETKWRVCGWRIRKGFTVAFICNLGYCSTRKNKKEGDGNNDQEKGSERKYNSAC